jgi:sialate O-acetylesterase
MMRRIVIALFAIAVWNTGFPQVRLPRFLSDGVILQREQKVKIFGWASENESVEVKFKEKSYSTRANANGEWSISLSPQKAGGPYEIRVKGKNDILIKGVLFGDVWVCSGQSNMELEMARVKGKYSDDIASSANRNIRQFLVPDRYNFKSAQQDFENGSWKSADPENLLQFSAVAYFFAKEIYDKHKVPIGIVNASLGGSPAEAWMSENALKQFPAYYDEANKFKSDSLIASIENSDRNRAIAWYSEINQRDIGLKEKWRAENVDDTNWDKMTISGYWADAGLGAKNGVVWFRRKITVPSSMVNSSSFLSLGRIVDQDSVFINGNFVGTTSYQYPPREYDVKPGTLRAGENTISIRVINNSGRGGFVTDKKYFLASGRDTIQLAGEWKYRLGVEMKPLAGPTFIRWKPLGLYNGMIAPLVNFPIKGVIWYQGESNTGKPKEYADLLPALIRNWRSKWNIGNFPFIFVQLANFMESKDQPGESNWAELRFSQLKSLSVPNTGMAVAIDIGEWNDIHPLNKKDVGKRLALQARKIAYGEKNLVADSPRPASAKFMGNKVEITFNGAGKGLTSKGGSVLNHFAVSGDGNTFVWADAVIKGSKVTVESKQISDIKVVRYAWADNPASANLVNSEQLPATPFELRKD